MKRTTTRRDLLRLAAGGALAALAPAGRLSAQSKDPLPRTRDYIVALVRAHPSIDPRMRPVQRIEPVPPSADARSAPGNEVVFDHFVGDLHLRYVFEDPQFMLALRVRDLERLKLRREELPTLVVENFRRLYPKVEVARPERWLGLVQNGGGLEPCTLLDGAFWQRQTSDFGGEVIAAVPSAREVYFTAREPRQNVDLLKTLAAQAHERAGKHAVSRAIYAWRNYRWALVA